MKMPRPEGVLGQSAWSTGISASAKIRQQERL
jgi:hypothetical protein